MQSAARPSGFADRAGGLLAPLLGMDQRRLGALLSLLLLAIGWSAIWSARSSYVVEGVVSRVYPRHYPLDLVDKFDLVVSTDAGRSIRFVGLHGGCAGSPGRFEPCVKSELPVGARIRIETNAFNDPNDCPGAGLGPRELRCTGRANRRFGRADFYVTKIDVAGVPVASGWSPNLGIFAWYSLVLALAVALWRRAWRLSEISARDMIIWCTALTTCLFAPLAWLF